MEPTVPQPCMLRGDEAELFAVHERPLRAAVRMRIRGSDALVEDACAHAWLQLMRRQPRRGPTLFAWLRAVAVHEAYRLSHAERHYDIEAVGHGDEPAEILEAKLDARSALRAVGTMTDHRQRIYLLHLAGHRYDEIADRLGITFTNVNRHVTRARRHLRLVRDEH